MQEFIVEAKKSLDNALDFHNQQDHATAAKVLQVMTVAFLLEAKKQMEKQQKLEDYLKQ